jgi:hypothetical protein
MTKPTTGRILRHITLWTPWIAYEFWGFYDKLDLFTPMLWAQTFYNCFSLIVSTYIAYGCALKFFGTAPSVKAFWSLSLTDKYRLLGNRYLIGIVSVILGYMSLSFWLDNHFFGIQYGEMVLHFKSRFAKLRELLAIALIYSYLKVHVFQSSQQLAIANWRAAIHEQTSNYLMTLFRKININP